LLTGGFIGVDIFFVISGFLISKIIFTELNQKSFKITRFYGKRIKRIFPALILVLISSILFGWISLYADEYKQLGKHVAGGAGFIENIILWQESGYFDNASETKPLLHLWSLGVEEQFYILFPLLAYFFWHRLQCINIFLYLLFSSFLLNILLIENHSEATFYLPATRLWELLIGTTLATYNLQYKITNHANTPYLKFNNYLTENKLSLIGISLLFFGFIYIDNTSLFPGYLATIPTIGTALIINAGHNAWLNKRILSNHILVYIGLISYPLYLWHWPLLSFLRILSPLPSNTAIITALIVAIIFASITYNFIEKPIRHGQKSNLKTVSLCLLMLATGVVGYDINRREGHDYRDVGFQYYLTKLNSKSLTSYNQQKTIQISEAEINNRKKHSEILKTLSFRLKTEPEFVNTITNDFNAVNKLNSKTHDIISCGIVKNDGNYTLTDSSCFNGKKTNQKNIFIIGDSHAGNAHTALSYAFPNINFLLINDAGCTPIRSRYKDHRCGKLMDFALEFSKNQTPDAIIFAARWPRSFYNLENDINNFKPYTKDLIVIGPSLRFEIAVNKILTRLPDNIDPIDYIESFSNKDIYETNQEMRAFSQKNDINFIDKIAYFCNISFCPLTTDGNDLFIFDTGHTTNSGAIHLGNRLLEADVMNKILNSDQPIQLP
jgi:peptidoglycan/LPS O-acetylase OafA/YrhL